jgi:hypothetical protein
MMKGGGENFSNGLLIARITGSHIVHRNIFVGGDKDQTFSLCLGNQHSVKWVAMQYRQVTGQLAMVKADGEFAETFILHH